MSSPELTQMPESVIAAPPIGAGPLSRWHSLGQIVRLWTSGSWGWLPLISLSHGIALLLIAVANTNARYGVPGSERLFWIGLITIFVSCFVRLLAVDSNRRERLGLVLLLGSSLYLVKVLHSPVAFTFHDEFAHWRTANDIIQTGRLFSDNPIIPASALYPGLEIVTAALVKTTGLSIYTAGLLLLGVARMVLVLALFLFFEQVSQSARIAGVATALYMANPNFLFFLGQYSYESVALPLALVVLFAIVRRAQTLGSGHFGLNVVVMIGLAAVITTHHLTSYAIVAFVGLWTLLYVYRARQTRVDGDEHDQLDPGGLALLILVISLAWMVYVASLTLGYLAPVLSRAVVGLVRMIAGEDSGRQLFQTSSGQVAPLLERATGLGSAALILLALPLGFYELWRGHRTRAIALALGIASLAYPVTLALRLTPRGWEVSNRSSEFLFLALGFMLAIALVRVLRSHRLTLLLGGPFAVYAAVIFAGGAIAGWPPAWRQPGPYLPASVTRSIDPQTTGAAEWIRDTLGTGNHVAADQASTLVMGSIGEQWTMSTLSGGIDPGWIMFAPEIDETVLRTLTRGEVRYLVIDQRLTGAPDLTEAYYPDTRMEDGFAKFDRIPGANRIYDSGQVMMYDLQALAHGP